MENTSPTWEYQVLIRESHLDTFGHVNNAAYLALFEEARWEIITKNGYGLNEIQREQIGPVLLEVELKFLREVRNRELITIRSSVGPQGNSKKTQLFHQAMVNQAGEVAVQARILFGLFDLRTRRLIEPTDKWKQALGQPN
jgi:YbgC/YbaW family acyl-CoA thioester hydrolase